VSRQCNGSASLQIGEVHLSNEAEATGRTGPRSAAVELGKKTTRWYFDGGCDPFAANRCRILLPPPSAAGALAWLAYPYGRGELIRIQCPDLLERGKLWKLNTLSDG
jgi:hypothetical protein